MSSFKQKYLPRLLSGLFERRIELDAALPQESARLLAVLEQRRLYPVYQPIVNLKTGEIFAYEALARCHDEMFASPLKLFDVAIQTGVSAELGRLLRELSIEQCPDYPLFLNINPTELHEPWLVRPDDAIYRHPELVYIEITESVPLSHFELCQSVINEARSKGVRLAVDDLGAGFSNLKYIADLSPEIVKLDRELIAGLHHSQRQQRLVAAIVRLCSEMGSQVVAEGIEQPEELEAVCRAGVHYAQGYLLARPAAPPPATQDIFSILSK